MPEDTGRGGGLRAEAQACPLVPVPQSPGCPQESVPCAAQLACYPRWHLLLTGPGAQGDWQQPPRDLYAEPRAALGRRANSRVHLWPRCRLERGQAWEGRVHTAWPSPLGILWVWQETPFGGSWVRWQVMPGAGCAFRQVEVMVGEGARHSDTNVAIPSSPPGPDTPSDLGHRVLDSLAEMGVRAPCGRLCMERCFGTCKVAHFCLRE